MGRCEGVMEINQEMIVVLDVGGSANQLLTRRIRELGVYSELHANSLSIDKLKALQPKGIILSGEDQTMSIDPALFELGIPILGICAGMGALVKHFGGQVQAVEGGGENGETPVYIDKEATLFQTLPKEQSVQ